MKRLFAIVVVSFVSVSVLFLAIRVVKLESELSEVRKFLTPDSKVEVFARQLREKQKQESLDKKTITP